MNHPYDKTWWIDGGKIMGGCYPGTLDVEEQHEMLRGLLECGITDFINLQQESDKARGQPFRDYMALARPIAMRMGLELGFERFGIPDQGTQSPAILAQCLDHLDGIIESGGKPYVHCHGGNGRTGTVIGCWLVRHGRTPDEAIEEMRLGRVGRGFTFPAPENAAQRQFIADWPTNDPVLRTQADSRRTA